MSCIFCKIANGEILAKIIYQDESIVAFNDLSPQAPQHCLIIPRQHLATLNDLTEKSEPLAGHMLCVAKQIAVDLGIAETGYRTVINCNADGGQAVYHLHIHLLGGRKMEWPPG